VQKKARAVVDTRAGSSRLQYIVPDALMASPSNFFTCVATTRHFKLTKFFAFRSSRYLSIKIYVKKLARYFGAVVLKYQVTAKNNSEKSVLAEGADYLQIYKKNRNTKND